MEKKTAKSAAQRMSEKRARDKASGMVDVRIKLSPAQIEKLKRAMFADDDVKPSVLVTAALGFVMSQGEKI